MFPMRNTARKGLIDISNVYRCSQWWSCLPDSKVHEAYMGPTWVLSAPGGPHVSPMKIAIRAGYARMAMDVYACKNTWISIP